MTDKKFLETIDVSIKVKIFKEDLEDILVTAFEGGINYWCPLVEIIGEPKGEDTIHHFVNGGVIRIWDNEDSENPKDWKHYDIGKFSLTEAIGKYANTDSSILYNDELDTGMIDADIADCIVQLAVFGELVYS